MSSERPKRETWPWRNSPFQDEETWPRNRIRPFYFVVSLNKAWRVDLVPLSFCSACAACLLSGRVPGNSEVRAAASRNVAGQGISLIVALAEIVARTEGHHAMGNALDKRLESRLCQSNKPQSDEEHGGDKTC